MIGRVEKVPDARHEEVEHSQFTRGKRGAETTSNAADGAFSTRPIIIVMGFSFRA